MYYENKSDCGNFVNPLPEGLRGFTENWGNGSVSVKHSLVLDAEKGELVKASGRVGKKTIGVSESKTLAALKSHSDAERRRRERINAHFSTLRDLVPNNEKKIFDWGAGYLPADVMDKASLLAEVINQVKQLRKTAAQACEGLHIPLDTDELEVEMLQKNESNGSFLLRASLCCDYSPDLLSDVRQAINNLPVKVLKCEVSTLGGRVKSVFLIIGNEERNNDDAAHEHIVRSLRLALSNILEKISASAEFAQLIYPQKRRRSNNVDSSCSSLL